MLDKLYFDALVKLEESSENRKDISDEVMSALKKDGFASDGKITGKGLEALEPYRAKRAIFIAAGIGSRMMPISLSCPKPLVRVNGVRIIDTLIDACVNAGIEDIVVIRGYLKDCFNQLTDKYPNIRFIDNPDYEKYNNISSAYLAKDLIENCYIFESDIYLVNQRLIKKYQYRSNYLAVPCSKTPDWCFDYDENDRITDLHKGGTSCAHMYGIGYYDKKAGDLFRKYIDEVFNHTPGGKDRFYDDVLCHFHPEEAEIYIRRCTFSDTMELDSFEELCEADERYRITN